MQVVIEPNLTLAELRERTGKSLAACADGIGVAVSTLHRWEQRKSHPSLENAVKVCQFYGVSIDYVIW